MFPSALASKSIHPMPNSLPSQSPNELAPQFDVSPFTTPATSATLIITHPPTT
ncbi:hypothetical protein BX661DRAFT_187198 [Kickxella alabastrina]|uniref:uncharacterized protein n=1 Tax=Kickxella alabastrina TaxID=61397 RepID=UPI00221E69EE|nr:uncharacterized protein BX661DRAFT_187198 [Kickxella alabastrina]KAI7822803.1 hypothetical protein BX661DRAFT_187198 [Kickxella alabastrina]